MKRILPPVWLSICLLLQIGLHLLFPISQLWSKPGAYAGIPFLVVGFGLAAWGAGTFSRAGTPVRPFETSTTLVTSGPYRFSRNPMYLGLLAILLGSAVLLGSATPFLVLPLFFGLIRDLFVIPEEVMMERYFGAEYLHYKARVRRWL